MAINERIVTGRKYRIATDNTGENWDRLSLWTSASDVEFNNGKNAEQRISELDRLKDISTITLSASKWSSTLPYTQTVDLTRITASDTPIISMGVPSTVTSANYKSMKKAYGYIDRVVSSNKKLTFYCYNKKPTVNINILVKGV